MGRLGITFVNTAQGEVGPIPPANRISSAQTKWIGQSRQKWGRMSRAVDSECANQIVIA